jgi:hypothetical protein
MNDMWATAMGAWSDDFADLMLPFDRLPLSRADLVFIGHGTPGFSFTIGDPCPEGFSQLFRSNLTQTMVRYPMGAHLRLELCSFRTGTATPRVVGANGALWLMRQSNPRVSGVIRRGLQDGRAMSLFVFPWLPIPQWAEFRVFVRNGVFAGASQYHAGDVFHQIAQHEAALKSGLDDFVAAALPRLKQPDVVMDVVAEPLQTGGFRIRLIDQAALGPRTDLGLFDRAGAAEFDGSFRFHRGDITLNMPMPLIELETTQHPATRHLPGQAVPPLAPEDDVWRT